MLRWSGVRPFNRMANLIELATQREMHISFLTFYASRTMNNQRVELRGVGIAMQSTSLKTP
eukprot:7388769-Lingulodinium_polyedra.AAC.1